MSAHEAVICVFTRMLHALDLRDWQGVRDAFADHVDVDYSSLAGAPAANVSGDDLVGGWRSFVGAFDATQHMTGPVVLAESREGEMKAAMHVRGYHRVAGAAGGETWMVAGHYQARLVHRRAGWRSHVEGALPGRQPGAAEDRPGAGAAAGADSRVRVSAGAGRGDNPTP
jgi:hypothetical protein